MGYRFTIGRIALGLLMLLQGILIIQGNSKEQLQQFKDLRSYLNKNQASKDTYWYQLSQAAGGSYTDQTLSMLVFGQAMIMVISGALVIANVRFGGLLMTGAMISLIATRDNPLLGTSELTWKLNF